MRTSATVNVQYLLSYLSEEFLLGWYLGEPVQFRQSVRSPLRSDENPGCTFYYKNNRLYFRDNALGKQYDFLNIVMMKYNLGYNDACRKVYHDFLGKKTNVRRINRVEHVEKETSLKIRSRSWTIEDNTYWSKFGITVPILNLFKVKPISGYWLNEYYIPVDELCYAYVLGDFKYKLYFVNRTKDQIRFIQNCTGNTPMGLHCLPAYSERIFEQKSYKDVMCSYAVGEASYCLANENALPTKEVVDLVRTKCNRLYTVKDFDYTGVKVANKHKKLYKSEPLFWKRKTREYYLKQHYDELPELAKDTSDTYALDNGQTVNYTLKYLKDYELYQAEESEREYVDKSDEYPFWNS